MTKEKIAEVLKKYPLPKGTVLLGCGSDGIKYTEEIKARFAIHAASINPYWADVKNHRNYNGWRPVSQDCLYADYPDSEIVKLNKAKVNPRYDNHFKRS